MSAVPKLRFPEFDGEWRDKKLKDNILLISGQHLSPEEYSADGEFPYFTGPTDFTNDVSKVKKWTSTSRSVAALGSILITVKGSGVGEMAQAQLDNVVIGRQLMSIEGDKASTNFLYQYLLKKRQLMKALASGNMMPGLSRADLFSISVSTPSLPEQQKIASFLSSVDNKIDLLRQKKDALETYKKGLMQKIFSQEIRFKQDDGSDFPGWEEVALGDIGGLFGGLTSKSSQDFGSGKRFSTYKQVFDRAEIDLSACAFVEIAEGEKQNTVQAGDVIFTTSSETQFEVGFAAVVPDHSGEIYLNSFCFGYRQVAPLKISPTFAQFLFRSEGYRRSVVLLAQGSTRFNISRTGFLKIRLRIPSDQEQAKISSLLLSLSRKIEAIDAAAESMETFKKGLLQQMFV